eukprot:TRINITY_DN859_c0_g1_i3.p1 TRINITY_DN859_c0_g1~~TRINITY_DN859_c0_g1_i3.p1  ORF type:complete len:241 (-),score=46.03 TRINITY_DN859_c0_g1_i3:76-798(-)
MCIRDRYQRRVHGESKFTIFSSTNNKLKICRQPLLKQQNYQKLRYILVNGYLFIKQAMSYRMIKKINNWEYIKREQLPAIANGVETIPILKNPETGIDKLLLISNFRPPVGTWSIEFPAGLIEANEGAQSAAIREFTEETGYQKFKFVDNPVNLKEQVCYFDPWKSTETNINFIIEVEEGSKGEQNLDKEESIDVFFLELDGNIVEKLMKYAEDKKQIISQDVWMFVLGFSYAKKFQKQS